MLGFSYIASLVGQEVPIVRVIHREGFVTVKLAQVCCWNAVRCEQALPYSCVQKARG